MSNRKSIKRHNPVKKMNNYILKIWGTSCWRNISAPFRKPWVARQHRACFLLNDESCTATQSSSRNSSSPRFSPEWFFSSLRLNSASSFSPGDDFSTDNVCENKLHVKLQHKYSLRSAKIVVLTFIFFKALLLTVSARKYSLRSARIYIFNEGNCIICHNTFLI